MPRIFSCYRAWDEVREDITRSKKEIVRLQEYLHVYTLDLKRYMYTFNVISL